MKKILLYIIACLFPYYGMGQNNDILQLSTTQQTGGTINGCTGIKLTPGFSFKSGTGKSLLLKIDDSVCSPKNDNMGISQNQNYIVTITPTSPTKSVEYSKWTNRLTIDRTQDAKANALVTIQYFDGLARPVQVVQRGITPSGNDLVTLQEYDPFSREHKTWLPTSMPGNNGAFVNASTVKSSSITMYSDERPFTEKVYEASPLNRVLAEYGVGVAWKNAPVKISYDTNSSSDSKLICAKYVVGGTRINPTMTSSGNYATGELYVTKTVNENDSCTSYEFKNMLGQIVLTRQIADNQNYDTYYVYDDFGNLCFVLPPLVAGKTDATTLNLYAYKYGYNERNLCIWKKLPGCDPIYYIYDKLDQLILTQDGEQRRNGEWLFSIPDAFGRVVLTGICKNSYNHTTNPLQGVVVSATFTKATNSLKGYTISNLSPTVSSLLSVNYYDNHDFLAYNSFPSLAYSPENGFDDKYENHKTLLTGSITALLDDPTKFLYSAMYYNKKGELIQAKSTNHLTNGFETEHIAYNFTGQPTKKIHRHDALGKTTTETYAYEYDHAGRLLNTRHKLDSGAEILLLSNKYYANSGRLESSTANSQSALTHKYTYNVRSWIMSITNNHFVEKLDYGLTGNINKQSWEENKKDRSYKFEYNGLSMLTAANYTGDGSFSTNYSYDKQGNVKTLTRHGITASGINNQIIDQLTFNYDGTGNQLKYVDDAGPNVALSTSADFKDYSKVKTAEYTYNKNGAMLTDLNKGQTVVYNSLNLPQEMLINNPSAKGKNYYTYSASGTKLRVKHLSDPTLQVTPVTGTSADTKYKTQTVTDYVGNKIYENNVLSKILTDNGYIENGKYYFYIKDHLGNNRIVADASGSVIQRNSYYPFGMSYGEESNDEQGKQDFKYNAKELDKMHGLNQYDYLARHMDPATIRFTTVDPHAENYFSWSPYVYVGNNPIGRIDPDGRDYWTTTDPSQIADLLNHLKAISLNETSEPFNYGDWTRLSDDEYRERNKDNTISFNDDDLTFNINLDDYKVNFKANMRGRESKNAYISPSGIEHLLVTEEESNIDISNNLLGFTVGASIEGFVGPHLLKNSKLAKMIYPRSAKVLGARAETSILSASMRRIWSRGGGVASKSIGSFFTPIGLALIYYDAWVIGRELGKVYGGDVWIKEYRKNKR